MYEIDKDVPIPPVMFKLTEYQEPINRLGIGHSFFVPTDKPESTRALLHKCALRAGITCTTRHIVEDGVKGMRVWRVK